MTDKQHPAKFDWATELLDAQGHVTLSAKEAHEIGARLRRLHTRIAASAGSEPVAEIGSAAGDDAEFGQRAIYPLVDIDHFEYGTKLYTHPSPPEGMVGGWQDIATAPKDGTYLLLWEQYSTNPFVGCWAFGSWSVSHEHVDAEGGWDGAIVVDSISQDRITHWMKLPPPPTTSAGSGKGE